MNVAAAIRLVACFDLPLAVIEPCGFVWDARRLRRVALDYVDQAQITRHASWTAFEAWRRQANARLILLTTRAAQSYCSLTFRRGDVLLAGQESAGVPDQVHRVADAQIRIPLAPGRRSLNVVQALAIAIGEAMRQINMPAAERAAHAGEGV